MVKILVMILNIILARNVYFLIYNESVKFKAAIIVEDYIYSLVLRYNFSVLFSV